MFLCRWLLSYIINTWVSAVCLICDTELSFIIAYIQEACDSALFCCALVNGQPCLKKTHAYYYQVQGQMAVTGLRCYDFAVWVGHDLHVECINFNHEM